MTEPLISARTARRMRAGRVYPSAGNGRHQARIEQIREPVNYAGPCRQCSCPSFVGDGMHCTRSYCWHHWNEHDA